MSVKESKMQPPPRKGKVTTGLKNVHGEQLLKLQMKHQQDSDFLDDIRNFSKMRAVIEKDYAQALLKLATSHLQKKAPVVPDGKSEDGQTYKTVYSVWRTMLDETEKIAKARLAATEVYQQQVSEGAKALRLYKLGVAKKCFENLKRMHEEIQTCTVEIDKTKKLYFEEEHMAHEAREKAHDADEKLKRKKGRIFQSISSLQKNSAKFSFRREACDIQATKARNDYVLALLAANAHQSKFYDTDLPELVQYLDCDIYDKVKEYILLIARTELLTCAACQSSFTIVQEQANQATKQYTMACFFRDNPVLSQPILYEFEPCDNDQINRLSIEHNAALCLSKEARRWASCVTKEIRVTRDSKAELKKLLAQIGDKPPYHLQSDQIGPQAELEARIDELRQIIRRSQTSKKKAEARLEAMREAGVNVEEWIRASDSDSVSVDSPGPEIFSRSGTVTSRASRKSYVSDHEESVEANDAFYDSDTAPEAPQSAGTDVTSEPSFMPDLTSAVDVVAAVQEAWDAAAETEEYEEPAPEPEPEPVAELEKSESVVVNGDVTAPVPGQKCVALFSYEALNSDELSFVEQEELELIGEGDGDGWVLARNYRGEEGYIPQNYVEVAEVQSAESASRPPLTSFSSVDYTMPSEDKEAGINVEEAAAVEQAVESVPAAGVERPTDLPTAEPGESIMCCQAIYDYEATCDEELSFFEGQIIRILRKKVFDVDDGWWEGELEGKVGLFPSLVVEELKENGEPLTPMTPLSPPDAPPPPAFTPPEAEYIMPAAQITLTQPTPEIEHPDGTVQKAVTLKMDEDFHVELNKSQQRQYQEQFSTSDMESSEHEAPAPEEGDNYEALVSSPESPTKTTESTLNKENADDGFEEINTEVAVPDAERATSEDCPTVVVTSITAGDTPTSDDDMELKEKEEVSKEKEETPREEVPKVEEEVPKEEEEVFKEEEVPKEKEEVPKEKEEVPKEKEEVPEEKEEVPVEKKVSKEKEEVSKEKEVVKEEDPWQGQAGGGASSGTVQGSDAFECSFADFGSDDFSQKVPSDFGKEMDAGHVTASKEAFGESEKMEVNGDSSKNFFSDSHSAETTG